jgi:hypothetical protein
MRRRLDLGPAEVSARLREAGARADLRPAHRLDAKIGLSPAAVTARLRLASALRDLCVRLGAGRRRPDPPPG